MQNIKEIYFQQIEPLLSPMLHHLGPPLQSFYNEVEDKFNQITQGIHFGWLCIIYSMLFFIVIRLVSTNKKWIAKNRELKNLGQRFAQWRFNLLLSVPFLGSYVNSKFKKQLEKQEKTTSEELKKHWDPKKCNSIPDDGMTEENLKKRINEWKEKQHQIWSTGKVSGAFYIQQKQHMEQMSNFAAPYLYQNPLHLGTYKELNKMENQVLNMTASLLSDQDRPLYGSITSGGSESLILALYAYRKFYPFRTKPNIVVPVTVHAAIDKGCFYLNIECRKARLNSQFKVDVEHVKSLIDKNTILIIGSAPNFPHGIIDPIDELAKIAKKNKVGFHIDGCLGGLIGVFDDKLRSLYSLDRDGVTSISLDHHKFGLAPKGISTLFFKFKQLRHCQYFCYTEWPGGLYETSTIPGSRPGFASAAAWYSLTQVTKKGFKMNAKEVIETTKNCAKQLRQIDNIEVFGEPQICALAFGIKGSPISPLSLSDYLSRMKKWNISPIHKPYGIHVSVTLANCHALQKKFANDIREGLEYLKNNKVKQTLSSAFYGASAKIPTDSMELQALKYLLSATLK